MQEYIILKEVSEILQFKDKRSVEMWCKEHHIPLVSCGKQSLVDPFLVQVALEKNFDKDIKTQYPSDWEIFYNLYYTKDILGYQSLLTHLEQQEQLPKYTSTINS